MEDQERLAETPLRVTKKPLRGDDRTTLKGLNPDVRSPAPNRAKSKRENQGIVKKMNRRKEHGKCTVCGSTRRVEGETHYLCDGCGSPLEELEPDPGFLPDGQTPTILRNSNDRNQLGSMIGPSSDKASEKLRKNHITTSYKKPRFIDIAISELVRKFGVCKVSEDAARLLIEVDTKESLGGIRKKRHGTKGMGKEESKEYRARAFAAAALHILNSNGQSNTAPQVARDWGLVYLDLASAIRMLRSNITGLDSTKREKPSVLRSRQLRHELDRLRSSCMSNSTWLKSIE